MKLILKIKLLLYRFFSTPSGKQVLKLLSFGIKVKNLNGRKTNKYPFLIVITTDTESGYVGDDERRIWQMEKPKAFEGYYCGIRNLVKLFEKHKIKTTFFLSTQCFSSKGDIYRKIKRELNNLIKNGHEIGLHLHPDSDFAIQKKLSKKYDATSAFFYTYAEKLKMVLAAKGLVKEHLGNTVSKQLVSFRWGNWALDTEAIKVLEKSGFKIDSSATPGIKGHSNDTMKYDWSKVNGHYPWKLNFLDYREIKNNNSRVLEIPIATFSFFGLKMRADPVNSVLLNEAFMKFYRKSDRSKKPFPFVVITHSPEAIYYGGKPTKTLNDLDKFISSAKKYDDVKFVTLKQAYDMLAIS